MNDFIKTPKPSLCLTFRSRDEPDITMALSEVSNWDDFLSRSETLGDEMVYIGWDGLDEAAPLKSGCSILPTGPRSSLHLKI